MPRASLKQYHAKRNFASTPEPKGRPGRPKTKRPIFCVQKHLASHLHYDFRLEHEGVLLSWAVPKGPSIKPGDKRLAMRVEDHPLDYAGFEGVIPEGYGAGIVVLWDKGTWTPESPDIAFALEKGELKFSLDGVKLKGSWVLVRTGRGGDARTWLLIKHRDDWAGDVDIAAFAPLSVKSGGDFAQILAQQKPDTWESHRSGGALAGAAAKALPALLRKAAEIRATKKLKKPKGRKPTPSRSSPARRRG